MVGRILQRHRYLLTALIPLAHAFFDDRVAAREPALVAETVEYPLGRMPLLSRDLHILIQPVIDGRDDASSLGRRIRNWR